ncbi:2-C-methyl-D-erythritol 4-phosphate cytidylyltransferase [Pseudolysobacter antarcticus]|uniref:2-C-methyl-D-erythritol 4-phosphate cytidylyltransferase n=1 Tax=Pseudolysobacter antarcticus TaxID=2511995 RepID=A0A411HKA5_9GAMM|nr:2-C-methyl-D-erythritol 4-phosphate cytidylyltransferase [Pseudolysobacter antarcticus]QBB70933.1 2-C-methyl-D-erythritol 4-phosphate cytidylyltransferase [Pseudolysobacter antarcticus]
MSAAPPTTTANSALWCIVPAAGRSARFGGEIPKQYLSLAGESLLLRTLERLATHAQIAGLVVVLAADDRHWPGINILHGKPVLTAIGGGERADSVLAGLLVLPTDVTSGHFILVHDAARPCLRHDDLSRLIAQAGAGDGGLLACPVRDTLKRATPDQHVMQTESRAALWRALTPQMFRRGALSAALQKASTEHIAVTDEAMAMELVGIRPLLVEGSEDNIKVTTPADLRLAEFLLQRA